MYATFQQAKQWVQPGAGTCDDSELARLVNTIRRHFYNFYQEMQLFADVVECYTVHRFCADPSGHGEYFRGFTLGREVASIEAMWFNQWPVTLRSSWREWYPGISPCCECGLEKFDLPGYFSTAADLTPGIPKRIRYRCDSPADNGKTMSLRGITAAGAPFSQQLTLSTDTQETAEALASIDHQGGVVKEVTTGRVVLADQDGRLLGIYEPDEVVASFRRVKVTGVPAECGVVNVRSARRYYPLTDDGDVVETDNQPAWDAMSRYLRLYERTSSDLADAKMMAVHLTTAKQHLLGDKARDTGKGTRMEMRVVTPGVVPHRMRISPMRSGRWGW